MVSMSGLKILVASAAFSLVWVSTASAQRGGSSSNGYSQAQIDAIIQQFQQSSGSSGSSGSGSSGSGSSGSSSGSGSSGSGSSGTGSSLFSSSSGSGSSGSGSSGSSSSSRSSTSTSTGGGGSRAAGGGSSTGGRATISQQQGGFIGGNSGENFIGGNLSGQNGGQQGGNRRTGGGGGNRQLDQGMMNQLNGGNGGGTASTKPTIRPRLKTAFTYPQTNVGNVVSNNRIRFEKLTVRYPQLNQVQIDSAENGRIILTGMVDSPETAKLAENLMRLEPGVRSIDNQLAVGTAVLPAPAAANSPQ